jgi:glycosyltransferase involved in cell wall biosynthesis
MIHILFVTSYTGLGGGEMMLVNLMSALDREQFEFALVCPHEGQLAQKIRDLGVEVHIIPFRGTTVGFIPAIWKRFPITNKLYHLVRDKKIDILVSDYHTLPFATAASRRAGIPLVWKLNGWWFPVLPWQRRFFQTQIDEIASISQITLDRWLVGKPYIKANHARAIVPGVNTDHFHPDGDVSPIRQRLGIGPEVPLVAMLARFQYVKGHDIFQEMVKLVHAQMPEVRFAVAGENVFGVSKDETYKNTILTNGREDPVLHDSLTYLGFCDSREVIAAADVIVCPSRFESLGMVHLESMAMERPVVSMNNGGPAEIMIDGETGYLVPPEDPAALADRVLALLRDPALRTRMGQAGRARVVEHFTVERYAEKFSQLFKTMYNQRNL